MATPDRSFKIYNTVLADAVPDDGTLTGIAYPSGTTQASFTGINAATGHVAILDDNDKYLNADPGISVSFGASTITLTNRSGETWAAGRRLALQLDYRESGPVTLSEGLGVQWFAFKINLATITTTQDVVTGFVPGFAGTVLKTEFIVDQPVTTGSKLASLNVEIGTTNVTGGVVALTSALATPMGARIEGTAVTAANTFTATDALSVEAASVTAFSEGSGTLLIKVRNDDTANAILAAANATYR